jgi:hypothetical protein
MAAVPVDHADQQSVACDDLTASITPDDLRTVVVPGNGFDRRDVLEG